MAKKKTAAQGTDVKTVLENFMPMVPMVPEPTPKEPDEPVQQNTCILQVNNSIVSRIKEALAKVDRVSRTALCAKLNVPTGDFNDAVQWLIEEDKTVDEDAIVTPPVLYLLLTPEESKQHSEKLDVAKKHDRYQALAWILENRTYREAYSSWEKFLWYELGMSLNDWDTAKRHARIMMLLAEKEIKLKVQPTGKVLDQLNQVRHNEEIFVACIAEYQNLPVKKQIAKNMAEIVAKHKNLNERKAALQKRYPDISDAEMNVLNILQGQARIDKNADGVKEFQLQPTEAGLIDLTNAYRLLPGDGGILSVARGQDLTGLVQRLYKMSVAWQAEKQKKQDQANWEAKGKAEGWDKPAADKPAADPAKPAADPDKPAADKPDADKPAADPDKPAADPDKPAADPDKPDEEGLNVERVDYTDQWAADKEAFVTATISRLYWIVHHQDEVQDMIFDLAEVASRLDY